jgi:L-asparaginase
MADALVGILVLYTGGTIGCEPFDPSDPDSPLVVAPWKQLVASCPALRKEGERYRIEKYEFDPAIDSTNMQPSDWVKMASIIEDRYDQFDGFVILHGTDTLVYTASALSFMLENLRKPVVLTGSQIPIIGNLRNDGEQNLISAIRIAAWRYNKLPPVPEVCIFFQDKLLRGNRARKVNASGFGGFESPNFPPLGEAGEQIRIFRDRLVKMPSENAKLRVRKNLETNIVPLPLFPGIQHGGLLDRIVELNCRAIVMHAYGTGNAPTDPAFLESIERCRNSDQPTHILDVSQCLKGVVDLGAYETSVKLLERGVLSGSDITPEAALCKVMVLLGDKDATPERIRADAQRNLAGEQSQSIFILQLERSGGELKAVTGGRRPRFRIPGSTRLPDGWSHENVTRAQLRLLDFEFSVPADVDKLEIGIYHDIGEGTEPDPKSKDFIVQVKREPKSLVSMLMIDIIGLVRDRSLKPGSGIPFILTLDSNVEGVSVAWERAELAIFTNE